MKNLSKYLTKKQLIIFGFSMLIILLSSFSYAFFISSDLRDVDVVTTECFKTTFVDENDINLDNAYPMSDSEGSRLTPYTFTIKNLCNKAGEYQVNVETKEESSLSTNYLRYKLNSYSSDILGQQLEVQEYINDNISESRNIEAGVILPNEEITYNLRLWIDEASTVSQSANKLYKGKVVIKTIENKEPYQTITLNANGGTLTHNEVVKVKQRKLGNIEEPELIGYFLEDWFSDSSLTNRVDENTIVTADLDNLYAKWVPRDDTEYRVEHYQMDTSGNYPSIPTETDNLTGTTDTNVTPEVKNYEHFIAPQNQTVNVNADGSQVVKYYYERVKYKQRVQGRYMDISGNYGSYTDIASSEQDVYYGATYSYSQAETVEYKAATPSISYTVTGEKLDNQVSFERRKYTQKVQARYMNIAGNYGSYSDVSGKTIDYYYGATVPAYNVAATTEYKAASVAAYTVTGEATKQMSFERNKYRITYSPNSGTVSPTYVDVYYNAATTLPTPTRSGFTFQGWYTATSGGTKYGNAGASYTVTAAKTMYAQWKDSSAPTLTLAKETYLSSAFSSWTLSSSGASVSSGVLTLSTADGRATSPFFDVGNGKSHYVFDAYTTSASPNYTPKGGARLTAYYYNANKETTHETTSGNNYEHNGRADQIPLSTWTACDFSIGYSGYRYLKILFHIDGTHSKAPVKIRNFKIYGEAIPNSFYDITLTPADPQTGIVKRKWASGSQSVSYFASSGTTITSNTFRVTANGTYTVYVENGDGMGTVKTITINKIS